MFEHSFLSALSFYPKPFLLDHIMSVTLHLCLGQTTETPLATANNEVSVCEEGPAAKCLIQLARCYRDTTDGNTATSDEKREACLLTAD